MPLVGNWPQEVDLPDTIGRHKFYIDNKPCCAIGHLNLILPRGGAEEKRWRAKYRLAASYVLGIPSRPPGFLSSSCERINDAFCNEDQRVLLYAVAWGLCWYKITGFPEAAKIVDAIERGEPGRFDEEMWQQLLERCK